MKKVKTNGTYTILRYPLFIIISRTSDKYKLINLLNLLRKYYHSMSGNVFKLINNNFVEDVIEKLQRTRKKLKYLYYTFIFNNKLHHNISTFLLLFLTSFRKFVYNFIKNLYQWRN
jgi:hypothetical protein